LRFKNIQLKTRIKQLDIDIEKKGKIIKSLKAKIANPGSVSAAYAIEMSSVMNKKKYLKELKCKLQEKTAIYEKMLTILKDYTKEVLHEKVELLTAKCKKIKNLIDKKNKANAVSEEEIKSESKRDELRMNEKQKRQNDKLTDLNKGSQQIDILIKRRESEVKELQNNILQLKQKVKEYKASEKDYVKYAQKVADSECELSNLKTQLNEDKNTQNKHNKVETLINEVKELKKQIKTKDKEISNTKHEDTELNMLKKELKKCTL